MKLAFYIPTWSSGVAANGIVTYYESLIPALCELGHEVFIVTANASSDQKKSPNVTVFKVNHTPGKLKNAFMNIADRLSPGNGAYYLGSWTITEGLKQILASNDIDLLQMEDSFGWSHSVSKAFVDIPVVVRLHGPHFLVGHHSSKGDLTQESHNRIRREGRALATARYVTAPSQSVMDQTAAKYHTEWSLSKVIPNAVKSVSPDQLWSLEKCDRENILFVGRFEHLKGGDLIIDAFATLASQRANVHLTFVGPDLGVAGENGKNIGIMEYIEANVPVSIRDRIQVLGRQTPMQIAPLRCKAFLTVVCSRYENFPNTALEALSFGCPLVATRVGGVSEIVNDGNNAVLIDSDDVEALAEKMNMIMDNPDMAESLSRQAVLDCADRFSSRNAANQTAKFFESVCKQHSK